MTPEMDRNLESSHEIDRNSGTEHQQGPYGLLEVLEKVERDLILSALQRSNGNKAKAARALGITERLMGIRVKRLGIDWRGFRARRKHQGAQVL